MVEFADAQFGNLLCLEAPRSSTNATLIACLQGQRSMQVDGRNQENLQNSISNRINTERNPLAKMQRHWMRAWIAFSQVDRSSPNAT